MMNYFSPAELTASYAAAGKKKALLPAGTILLLGVLAGALIALAGAGANTATHNLTAAGTARLINGMVFPFGLIMVVLMGAELFTGNCLIIISVLDRQVKAAGMLRNWVLAYIGNLIGSVLVAAACSFSGQFNYSSAGLAVSTVKCAAAKCSLTFGNAFILGLLCNFLVCIAVLMAFAAKDVPGKVLGIFAPICLFVVCGFEHSVANMYYIPAGLFALNVPAYAKAVADAGLDVSALTWGNFFLRNLLPVTLGNIVGGCGIGAMMWACFLHPVEKKD